MKLFEKNNILIARFSSIGDVLLTTPILRALRNKFPDSNIDYITTGKMQDLIRFNPHIDNIWTFEKSESKQDLYALKSKMLNNINANKYDILIDLQNNLRSNFLLNGIANKSFYLKKNRLYKLALVHLKKQIKKPQHIVDRYFECAAELGIEADGLGLELFLEPGSEQATESSRKIIGIAAGAQHFTKQWLPEHFAELINMIAKEYNAEFRFFGSPDEKRIVSEITGKINAEYVDFTGKLSLLESAREIDYCDYFITNDTGLMHIASARKVPIVAIFGSTVPELGFSPYNIEHKIAETSLNCRPCSHIGKSKCPKSHFRCMKKLSPEIVFEKFRELSEKK